MNFTDQELSAIFMVTKLMILADGKVNPMETGLLSEESFRLGVPDHKLPTLMQAADRMQASDAFAILAGMNPNKKKYVAAFLGTIMSIDGDIDPAEHALWTIVSTACQFPLMTIADAIVYIGEKMK